jgi:hypothetical protein
MGAFFITNDDTCLEKVTALMSDKGLTRFQAIRLGGATVLAFRKRFVAEDGGVLRDGDDVVAGFGTYAYKDRFGSRALGAIHEDLIAGRDVWPAVRGHFCFAAAVGGDLHFVSDKCGVYHGYLGRRGERFYASSSLFAVATALPSLSVSPQECLEYLFTQATYGGATLFPEIRHLDPGAVYALADFEKRLDYYSPARARVSVEEYLAAATEYLGGYRDGDLAFSCDMSGGYDSRTVGALLEHAGVDFVYNTNTNRSDPLDHQVAIEVAAAAGRAIERFDHIDDGTPFADRVERCFNELEICRDVFTAVETPAFFSRKAEAFDVVMGGYGGELLRDKYSRFRSLREMVENAYIDAGVPLDADIRAGYLDALEGKFTSRLESLRPPDVKTAVEQIYYLEKMRFWGGSRVTAFNGYCHRVHPLLDDLLARYSFGFTLEEKRDAAIQRRIMTAASPAMAAVRSSHDGRPLRWTPDRGSAPSGARAAAALRKMKRTLDGWIVAARNVPLLSPSRSRRYRSAFSQKGYLRALLRIDAADVYNLKMLGRYLTLEKTLHTFREKLSNLDPR